MRSTTLQLTWSMLAGLASSISLSTTDSNSIKSASSQVAYGMMKYYQGNETGGSPGNLPQPYYWWEAGAMFMTMVQYWYYTGDTTYNNETAEAMIFQAGTVGDFMPQNQTTTEGNDDQVFWAYSAMTAAELGFPAPPEGDPSWLAMAQAVFNEQVSRWDNTTCNGGLRWQIFTFNNGYTYKNVASNGGFFQLASRLARYTGNSTYVNWADTAWDWFSGSTLLQQPGYQIWDGASDTTNCSEPDRVAWSYNYGLYLGGLAYLYNHTSDQKYMAPIEGIVNSTLNTFAPQNKVLAEVACEPTGVCDNDEHTFKGFTAHWLALTAQLVPSTAAQIWPYLEASAQAAATQCSGGTDGMTCGTKWTQATWDGTYGVGEQMSALSVIQSLMVNQGAKAPLTSSTGGTSKSDPNAGTPAGDPTLQDEPAIYTRTITMGDKAGAGILTAVVLAVVIGGTSWLMFSKD